MSDLETTALELGVILEATPANSSMLIYSCLRMFACVIILPMYVCMFYIYIYIYSSTFFWGWRVSLRVEGVCRYQKRIYVVSLRLIMLYLGQ